MGIFSHHRTISLKVNYIKLKKSFKGHNLPILWNQVKGEFSDQAIWPDKIYFDMYRNFFIRGCVKNKEITGLPAPENFYKAELAYWIDNIRDLKYGFDLEETIVSAVHVSYEKMNPAFLKLFKNLRDKYKNKSLNKRFIEKINDLFPDPNFRKDAIAMLI